MAIGSVALTRDGTFPHPARDASHRRLHRRLVAAAAREGPLELMRCAREGATHGSERNTLGTNAEGVFMFAREHTMEPTLLLRGFVLGFTIAAAVGPISLLCIRRTLAEGRLIGLVSGMGVATADATYGAIAAFGLTAITDLLVDWRRALGIIGGAFLLWLAWRTLRFVPREAAEEGGAHRGLPSAFLSTLGLTLTNPMTILSFAALFIGLGVTGGDLAGATLLTLGVFSGSAFWWVVLITLVGALRSRLTTTGLRRVNIASGLLIGGFAIVAIASALL